MENHLLICTTVKVRNTNCVSKNYDRLLNFLKLQTANAYFYHSSELCHFQWLYQVQTVTITNNRWCVQRSNFCLQLVIFLKQPSSPLYYSIPVILQVCSCALHVKFHCFILVEYLTALVMCLVHTWLYVSRIL